MRVSEQRSTWLLVDVIGPVTRLRIKAVVVSALLLVGLAFGETMTSVFEEQLYNDEIVHARSRRRTSASW